ncbi:MotA/TolQ/ExbB proton channel family protein [Sphingopyxis sp. MWB1]|uniref:MotA/TolQ/ExbB proton channel family protein n=1 Tax=Sphingopyxis sp. MWB1 TaxID=1537715 RepID=UPI00051A37BD|nr:MotA/TolQ/ExbB proton channel family protein [Sphingopyxis sp. MWB1]
MPAAMCVKKEGENPYGMIPALCDGGIVGQLTFLVLLIMFVGTLYILFTKLFEQNKVISQGKHVDANFWRAPTLAEGAAKLEKNSAYRQVVEDGLRANEEHTKLTDPVEAHDWMHGTLERSQGHINSKLNSGLAFLATVGSTAPFVGLFGTVIGILRALVKIGASGQASIDTVAGPVGEALIMTAVGLIVAVPAVLAFNWLQSRNKAIARSLSTFSNDVLGSIMSGGQVKPVPAAAPAKTAAAPAAAPKKA